MDEASEAADEAMLDKLRLRGIEYLLLRGSSLKYKVNILAFLRPGFVTTLVTRLLA
jgi:hypothetical protein